jgi:hypothetical protein
LPGGVYGAFLARTGPSSGSNLSVNPTDHAFVAHQKWTTGPALRRSARPETAYKAAITPLGILMELVAISVPYAGRFRRCKNEAM